MVAKSISELDQAIVKCNKCPRLVAWRKEVSITKRKSYENEKYWGKPVPGFGDSNPEFLILGLAPGAHGANRLASNSLLEGLVFGTRIAETIAKNISPQEEPVEDRSPTFLADSSIKMPLQLAMSQGAGVMRSEKSLNETLALLEKLGTHQSNSPRIENWETSNLYQLATAIVKAALIRKETRGSHWRSDFPESHTNWQKHIIQSLNDQGIWSEREEVVKDGAK